VVIERSFLLRVERASWYDSDLSSTDRESTMAAIRAPKHAPQRDAPPRFQFSLGWLMIVVTVLCIALGAWEILPTRMIGYLVVDPFVLGVVPTVLIVCGIYARGDTRAFAIGALVPLVSLILTRDGEFTILGLAIWMIFVGGLCGALAVALRRWLAYHDAPE
jgi:hypothetical protein